jgi:hypothetical protein
MFKVEVDVLVSRFNQGRSWTLRTCINHQFWPEINHLKGPFILYLHLDKLLSIKTLYKHNPKVLLTISSNSAVQIPFV